MRTREWDIENRRLKMVDQCVLLSEFTYISQNSDSEGSDLISKATSRAHPAKMTEIPKSTHVLQTGFDRYFPSDYGVVYPAPPYTRVNFWSDQMKLEFGDMIFYSVAGLVLILLLWLRFIEAYVGLWGAWIIWFLWSAFLIYQYLKTRLKGGSS